MNTPALNTHDTNGQARRVNGQFDTVHRTETVDTVHLTGAWMPGLTPDEARQWRDLDAIIEQSGFTPDALTVDEEREYSALCAKIDTARAAGVEGTLPECPCHRDREFPGESDQWGKDVRCHVCFSDDGSLVSVNRLGLRDKAGVHKWAVWGFKQHMAELDRAYLLRQEVNRRTAGRGA